MQQLRVYPLIALSDGVIFEKWFVYILLFFSSASLWHIKRSFERGSLFYFSSFGSGRGRRNHHCLLQKTHKGL